MFRQINKSLWSQIAPMRRNYYAHNKSSASNSCADELCTCIKPSVFILNSDDCVSTTAVAASAVSLEDAATNNFTSMRIDVTKAAVKAQYNQYGSSDTIKVINISLQQTPKELRKFNRCTILGDVIFSLAQVADKLLSFLLDSAGDISDVSEVFCLLGAIKLTSSTEIHEKVIKHIDTERHINVCRKILHKHSVSTNGELCELYCCYGYLLLLDKQLRACLFKFHLWFW